MLNDDNIIKTHHQQNRQVVVFLTLQNLAGGVTKEGRRIKEQHQAVFNTPIDLLIIGETHFGAGAPIYGKVLRGKLTDHDLNQAKELDRQITSSNKDTDGDFFTIRWDNYSKIPTLNADVLVYTFQVHRIVF
ncbi:MAG: hypothetical protein LBP35_00355 [Candidatus Ancillula trichonymphae]|nr:hypothetical protein [Candidatus Ancillula trichonymphae]